MCYHPESQARTTVSTNQSTPCPSLWQIVKSRLRKGSPVSLQGIKSQEIFWLVYLFSCLEFLHSVVPGSKSPAGPEHAVQQQGTLSNLPHSSSEPQAASVRPLSSPSIRESAQHRRSLGEWKIPSQVQLSSCPSTPVCEGSQGWALVNLDSAGSPLPDIVTSFQSLSHDVSMICAYEYLTTGTKDNLKTILWAKPHCLCSIPETRVVQERMPTNCPVTPPP